MKHLIRRIIHPTGRAYGFLGTALALYFFGNQTQVGWLYVMSALLAGIAAAAWWLNRRSLAGVTGERSISPVELYEGDSVNVTLTLQAGKRAAEHIRTAEHCPLAAPDSGQREVSVFVPVLPAAGQVEFTYQVMADRRGVHEFPALHLISRAPFGLFIRQASLNVPSRTLVYPEVRTIHRLSLFDKQPAAQSSAVRAGLGGEVIGARPYRPGDSPRHIHWRSVARTGVLISKEFADETQPGLSLVLDLFAHPYPDMQSKHTPFEWAVKIAASIGDYAQRRNYPLYLALDRDVIAAPYTPLSQDALLQILARVQPTGVERLADVVRAARLQTFAAVLMPWPDDAAVEALLALNRRGLALLAVMPDPATFPTAGLSAARAAGTLQANGIDTRLVSFGEDWLSTLNESFRQAVPAQ